MTTGPAARESPLLAHLDGATRHAHFAVRPIVGGELAWVEGLLAGAAEVDITPPPGLPKAGYSANAHDGSGFRTRLRARVLHLRAGATSIAWVQCDLLGGSSVLHHLVARAIAADTDVRVGGLLIGATHTHAGPGQFLGTDFYNRFASNRSGFDPAFTQFLVERITRAVLEAVTTRRPARMAVGATEVWGLTRNRSLDPHLSNLTVADKRTEAQRKYLAVNPDLHLVRVDAAAPDGGHEPLAAIVVFSVHGTGISMKAEEYNADLWAYIVGELAHHIDRTHSARPVVGAVEGTHADVAPAIRPGRAGYLEAERIGRAIGSEAAALYERLEGELREDVVLGAGLREIDLDQPDHRSIDGVELAGRPAVGAALMAGAHENLTPMISRIPPFRPGSPKRWGATGPHGSKWIVGSRWLQPLVIPRRSFPRVLPVSVLRLDTMVLVGLPFEITVETGRRIEAAVDGALRGTGVRRAVVSSVANEYAGYVATAEEYGRQFYEGGHTLYGPRTQRFFAAHAARLAIEVARSGTVTDVVLAHRWDLKVHRYLPAADPPPVDRSMLAAATYTDPTGEVDGYWQVAWADLAPGGLHWHEPLVRVEAADGDDAWSTARRHGHPVDDRGWHVEVTHLGPHRDGAHRYRARWYDPAFRGGRRHRFVLEANGGQPVLASEPFD